MARANLGDSESFLEVCGVMSHRPSVASSIDMHRASFSKHMDRVTENFMGSASLICSRYELSIAKRLLEIDPSSKMLTVESSE